MTHFGFIATSYALAVGVALWLGIGAALRTATVRRKLRAIDPREGRA